jgi:flagellar assembly protein FliH
MTHSSNPPVPKEQLSAYQRWEMTSFGDDRPSTIAKRKPVIPMPTAEEVARIKVEAKMKGMSEGKQSGYAEGYAEGLAQGRAQALAAGHAQTAQELVFLQQLSSSFAAAVTAADETIARDMLNLALDLSRAMLKTALAVRPELIIALIRDAVDHLPNLQQPAQLHLHPDDLLLVQEHIGDELSKAGWRLLEDPHLERGGCLIDTAGNHVDATTTTRWKRLAAALGNDTGWMA